MLISFSMVYVKHIHIKSNNTGVATTAIIYNEAWQYVIIFVCVVIIIAC